MDGVWIFLPTVGTSGNQKPITLSRLTELVLRVAAQLLGITIENRLPSSITLIQYQNAANSRTIGVFDMYPQVDSTNSSKVSVSLGTRWKMDVIPLWLSTLATGHKLPGSCIFAN